MKKTLKNIVLSGIASIAFFASINESKAQELVYEAGWNLSTRRYSLDLTESKTIPVHPDDSRFLRGNTEVKAEEHGVKPFVLEARADVRAKLKNGFGIFAGLGAEYEIIDSETMLGSDHKMWAVAPQSSDNRGGYGSWVYDTLDIEKGGLFPLIGIGFTGKKLCADLEYSLDTRKVTREWGHHRYGEKEKIGAETYDRGNRFGIKLGYTGEPSIFGGLSLNYGEYKLGNSGKLTDYSVGLFIKKEF